MDTTTLREWWRPELPPQPEPTAAGQSEAQTEASIGGRLAFGAIVTFTLILFTAPQERISVLAALRIALLAAGVAFVSYWVDRIVSARPAPPPAREVTLVYGLLAWATITIPFSIWPGGSYEVLNEYVKAVLVFWLLAATLLTVGRLKVMAWTLSLASLPLALTAVVNFASGVYDEGRVAGYQSGIAHNPNDLALTLNIVLPLTMALLWSARTMTTRLALAGIIAFNTIGVVVTFSRGGFLTLLVIALLTLISMLRRRAAAVTTVVVLFIAAMPLLPAGYLDRIATITDVESDPTGSSQDRWRDTVAAAGLVVENPLLGVGLGQDVLALNEVRGETWKNVHNIYLQYGVDLGLPGMALFVAMLVTAIAGARRVERAGRGDADPDRQDLATLAGAVRIGLLAFMVAGLFHPVAYYFYFYYLAGLAVAVQRTAILSGATDESASARTTT
jgi:probable O-glycosylation ligase (exosortase A-associated)